MNTFKWDQRYVTGITQVDEQHQILMNIINRFGEHLYDRNEINWSLIDQIFIEVSEYAQFHFTEEEELMAETGLMPEYVMEHKELHHYFVREVSNMHAELSSGKYENAVTLFNFLLHWLTSHILIVDKKMAQQIKAVQNGVSPDLAHRESDWGSNQDSALLLDSIQILMKIIFDRNKELQLLNLSLEAKITERTQALQDANQQLEKLALTDVLTGLPNRRHALCSLERLWQESLDQNKPLSLMIIDADGFKTVNDTFGHDAGDALLIAVARELTDSLRTDDIVCRLGGDEFIVLCPLTPFQDALQVAEKLRKKIAVLQVPAGIGSWKGSISVGVAERMDLPNSEALIKTADEGVYAAKRNGRNRVESVQCSTEQ